MFINYNEQELTSLFKTEPIDIFEKEAGIFIYSFSDIDGVKVTINVSIYEKEVTLILSKKEKIVLEKKLKNVESLLSENNCLRICQNEAEQDILIQFSPKVLVRYDK